MASKERAPGKIEVSLHRRDTSANIGTNQSLKEDNDDLGSTCKSERNNEKYNLGLHIAALFTVLFTSLIAAVGSMLIVRLPTLTINETALNTGKHFGTGVVLSTGFIHMLPAAFEALTDPCIPSSISSYSAFAGLFALIAALIMQLIEFLAGQHHRQLQKKQNRHITTNVKATEEGAKHEASLELLGGASGPLNKEEVLPGTGNSGGTHHEGHCHGLSLSQNSEHKLSTYLLELGIALHSILIGLALGTATGSEFVSLFAALVLHQFFEGFALGSRIGEIEYASLIAPLAMCVFFSLTTPFGTAIGIILRQHMFDPKDPAYLVADGILDAASAGILIHMALVNLIATEFSNSEAFWKLPASKQMIYYFALYTGAAIMALIGIWA